MAVVRTKTALIIISLIIMVLLAAIVVLFVPTQKTAAPESPSSSQTTQELSSGENSNSQETPVDTSTIKSGSYIDYKDGVIEATAGTKILFFHAPWCPQCRQAEESIKSTTLPDNLTIIKVDYDSRQDLRQKYGVTLQTTFVKVDDKGEKQDSFVAYSEPSFEAIKRELL